MTELKSNSNLEKILARKKLAPLELTVLMEKAENELLPKGLNKEQLAEHKVE